MFGGVSTATLGCPNDVRPLCDHEAMDTTTTCAGSPSPGRPPWAVLTWLVSLPLGLGSTAIVAGGRLGLEWALVGLGIWALLGVSGHYWARRAASSVPLWAAFLDLRRKSLPYRDIPDPLPLSGVADVQRIVTARMEAEETLAEALAGRGVPQRLAFKVTAWLTEQMTPRSRVKSI